MIFLAILILFALFFGFCYYENNKIDVSYYNIKSKDATKNFKIVHLSDFHSKPFKKVLKRTQKEKPQIKGVPAIVAFLMNVLKATAAQYWGLMKTKPISAITRQEKTVHLYIKI